VGEFTDGDHRDLVLLVLGVAVGDVDEVGGLALQPELQRLGAGRTAELVVRDEAGEATSSL
jgi:hypothetical protein